MTPAAVLRALLGRRGENADKQRLAENGKSELQRGKDSELWARAPSSRVIISVLPGAESAETRNRSGGG